MCTFRVRRASGFQIRDVQTYSTTCQVWNYFIIIRRKKINNNKYVFRYDATSNKINTSRL